MSLLADISAYLVAQSIGTANDAVKEGWGISIGKMPNHKDRMIGLFEYGGYPPELTHDKSMDVMPALQVRVRGEPGSAGYTAGIAKADAILALLHGLSNTTLTSTSYKLIRANNSPAFIGSDDRGRPEWTINFSIIKAP